MQIHLKSLSFYAYHGVLPQEREVGGRYLVDLSATVSDRRAHEALCHDRLEATVNYADIYQTVCDEMAQPSALLEHVAGRMARALLAKFSEIEEVALTVTKCEPPIAGFAGQGAAVSYRLRRRLIVWDFDGTLADTSGGIVQTMQATFRRCGLPLPSPEAVRQTIGLPLPESIARLGGLEGKPLDEAVATYRELFEEIGTRNVQLFPGIAEALRRHTEAGHLQAIATSRGHLSVEQLCEKLGIRHHFHFIVACEDVACHKPDPTPVLALARMAGVAPADVEVIGDTTFDIEMGRRARAGACTGVAWGNHSPQRLLTAGADFVAEKAESL